MFHIILLLYMTKSSLAAEPPSALHGCQERCGNVDIPYPFGIGRNCSVHDGFVITCNRKFNPPRPFLNGTSLEVLGISLNNTMLVNTPVFSSGSSSYDLFVRDVHVNLSDIPLLPFSFSSSRNRFVSTSCNNFAKLMVGDDVITGCMSICNYNVSSGCNGINCCMTTLPHSLRFISASIEKMKADYNNDHSRCKSMFVADQKWVADHAEKNFGSVEKMTQVPTQVDWRIYSGNMTLFGNTSSAYCTNFTVGGYRCFCAPAYEGNPYLPRGCIDIYANMTIDVCKMKCLISNGSHYCDCSVRFGGIVLILGICIGLTALFFLVGCCCWKWRLIKRRKEAKLKLKFFKRNGGLLLQQQVSSHHGNFEMKLFTSKELEKATENYNINRVLGQGGQGTVYKGMLTDGRIVAIKKAKIVDEGQLSPFINEVVILSQINHRNIVKLLGCCLETEVPMLVYEYVPNGTLFQYIHSEIEDFPLYWPLRLRLAVEVAGALSYLHSAAAMPIYHRDIKTTNILLDEKYRAKVSDFGTSRSVCIDQTHLTTVVKGTFGYLDPEYFQSSQFTEKSDVYSFGVVLVELLTGQKAVSSIRTEEWRGLASYFVSKMEENQLLDILDSQVAKEGEEKEIVVVANLARRCLHLNGRQRPTMREVLLELESIRLPNIESSVKENPQEIKNPIVEVCWESETSSTSLRSFLE